MGEGLEFGGRGGFVAIGPMAGIDLNGCFVDESEVEIK